MHKLAMDALKQMTKLESLESAYIYIGKELYSKFKQKVDEAIDKGEALPFYWGSSNGLATFMGLRIIVDKESEDRLEVMGTFKKKRVKKDEC